MSSKGSGPRGFGQDQLEAVCRIEARYWERALAFVLLSVWCCAGCARWRDKGTLSDKSLALSAQLADGKPQWLAQSRALQVVWSRQLEVPLERGRYEPLMLAAPLWLRDSAGPSGGMVQASPNRDTKEDQGVLVLSHPTKPVVLFFDHRGKEIGRIALPSIGAGHPVYCRAKDVLFVGTEDSHALGIKLDTGEVLWQTTVTGLPVGEGACESNRLYFRSTGGHVNALDAASGELLWRYRRRPEDGLSTSGSPGVTLDDDRVLTGFADGFVVALDRSSGEVRWERDAALEASSLDRSSTPFLDVDTTPRVGLGSVLVAGFSIGAFALGPYSGSVKWFDNRIIGVVDIALDVQLGSAYWAGTFGVFASSGRKHHDESILWHLRYEAQSPSALRIAGDSLFVSDSRWGVVAIDRKRGEMVSYVSTAHGVTQPVAVADTLAFAISNAGLLLALRVP